MDRVCSDCDAAGIASAFVARLLISNGVDDGASSFLSLRFVMSRGAVRASSAAASVDAILEVARTQMGMGMSPANAKPIRTVDS